jgi:hypothetical protein
MRFGTLRTSVSKMINPIIITTVKYKMQGFVRGLCHEIRSDVDLGQQKDKLHHHNHRKHISQFGQ